MKKILLWTLISFVITILLILSVNFYFIIYRDYKWYQSAEDLSPAEIGSPIFNLRLINCSPSFNERGFSEPWDIKGIRDDKCLVIYQKLIDTTLEEDVAEGKVRYMKHECLLPLDVYSNPDDISWIDIINSEHCY